MKRLLATLLSIISIMNLALPQFVAAEAGTENYIIDECDFESGVANWQVMLTDGITYGTEQLDDEHGLSYRIVVPEGKTTYYSFSKKTDSFEKGEVTIEADFRYNTANANIKLFALRNDSNTDTDEFVPNLLNMGKINGNDVAINQWHHIKYVMNIEEQYSRTYIDDALVASSDNVAAIKRFGDVRINLTPTGTTPVIFYIDNIKIMHTQNNITADRAEVSSVEFFDVSGVSYGTSSAEVTEDLFYANITMTKAVAGIPLRNRAIKASIDGVPTDVYAYGEGIAATPDYQYGWDHDYVDAFTVYFSERPAPGSVVQLDLTDLYDANNLRVNENCIITVTVEGDALTDVAWSLKKEDGSEVLTTTQLSNDDRVQAVATVTGGTDIAGKNAILAIAAYDGDKMADIVTSDVTIPASEGVLTTDYLTVKKTSDYTIKEFLVLKENITPVANANAVTSVYEEEQSQVKNEMTVGYTSYYDYVVDSATYENGDTSLMSEYHPNSDAQLAIMDDPTNSGRGKVMGYNKGTYDTLYIRNDTATFSGIEEICMEMDIWTSDASIESTFEIRSPSGSATGNSGEPTTEIKVNEMDIEAKQWYRIRYIVNAVTSHQEMWISSDNGNTWENVYNGATNTTMGGSFASTRVYVNKRKKGVDYEFYMDNIKIYEKRKSLGFTRHIDSGYVSPYSLMRLDYDGAKDFFADTICLVADSNFFWGMDTKYEVTDKAIWYEEDLYASVSMLNTIFGTKTYPFSRKINGKDYVSVKRAADEVLNLYVDVSDHGMAVISNRKFNISNEINRIKVDNMIRYITGERPTVDMLREAVKNLTHPYLIPMDRLAEIKAKILAGDEELKEISDSIIAQAGNSYNMTPFANQQGGYYYGMVSDDVLNNYWAYYMTGDESYATKVIEDAVEMASWNHLWGGTFYLQTTRAANALAYVYDLFYDKLTQDQKNAISYQITRWGIYESRTYRTNGGWPRRLNNWNTFNNAGIILSALAVREDAMGLVQNRIVGTETQAVSSSAEYVMELFASAIQGLEYQQQMWGPNGGAMEGMSYFMEIINKYVEALTALESALGTDFSLTAVPGFLASGNTAAYHHSSKGIFSLAETSINSRTLQSSGTPYMAYKLGDLDMQRRRMHLAIMPGAKFTFQDLIWHMDDDKANRYTIDMPLDVNYSYSEIASSRSTWDDNATFLAIHAGQNDFSHFQFDAGTFVFHSQGVEFANDTGAEAYKTEYEKGGEDGPRKNYYVARAEGHNLFIVNADDNPDQEFHAETEIVTVDAKPNGVIYNVDLTPAYIGRVKQAKRGYMLTEGRKVFVLQDEIKPLSQSDEYHWFWHTKADAVVDNATTRQEDLTLANGSVVTNVIQETEAAKSHRVTLTRDFKQLNLYFESNVDFTISFGLNAPLETSPVVEGQSIIGKMNKITAHFEADADEVMFRVTAVPYGTSYVRPSLGKMSGWTVEDGIRSEEYTIGIDTISNVKYGETVEEFLSNVFVEESKKVTLNGNEVTTGTLQNGMKLIADGRTLDIVYIPSEAIVQTQTNTIVGYSESDSVERMIEELAIVFGDGITAQPQTGNIIDGMTVTADDNTYTVRTSNSMVLNSIANVKEDTPTAIMLSDLESVIGEATADSDIVYNGMKVTSARGQSYIVQTIAPDYEYNFDDSTSELDASRVGYSYRNTDFGFDMVYVSAAGSNGTAQDGITLKAEESDRGSKALHLTSDGTATNNITFQLMDLTEGMTEGKYKVEFMYKPESEASWLRLSQNYAGNGVVNGGGFQNHLYMHFKNDGQIQFGIESLTENYNVGMWEPNEWYHVEIELNPVEDWRFKLKINDRLVAEGHHPSFLKPMTRLQVQMIAQAGEETSMWLDDIKFTRIYG